MGWACPRPGQQPSPNPFGDAPGGQKGRFDGVGVGSRSAGGGGGWGRPRCVFLLGGLTRTRRGKKNTSVGVVSDSLPSPSTPTNTRLLPPPPLPPQDARLHAVRPVLDRGVRRPDRAGGPGPGPGGPGRVRRGAGPGERMMGVLEKREGNWRGARCVGGGGRNGPRPACDHHIGSRLGLAVQCAGCGGRVCHSACARRR